MSFKQTSYRSEMLFGIAVVDNERYVDNFVFTIIRGASMKETAVITKDSVKEFVEQLGILLALRISNYMRKHEDGDETKFPTASSSLHWGKR